MSDLKVWFDEADLVEESHDNYYLEEGINRLGDLAEIIHKRNQHFYRDIVTGEPIDRNVGELIALIHSEASEMLEGVRKNIPDTHLPHRRMEEVECADLLIRIFDYAGYRKLDISGALREKLEYNRTRKDHTHEARRETHGKKF